jgi:hypothetical protein
VALAKAPFDAPGLYADWGARAVALAKAPFGALGLRSRRASSCGASAEAGRQGGASAVALATAQTGASGRHSDWGLVALRRRHSPVLSERISDPTLAAEAAWAGKLSLQTKLQTNCATRSDTSHHQPGSSE